MSVTKMQHTSGRERANAAVQPMVLGWCLWLLGSWAVALTISSAVPAARWMIFSSMVGWLAVWPAARLSGQVRKARKDTAQPEAAEAGVVRPGYIFLEWFCLAMVFQAVLWPLRLVAGWSIEQVLWVDAAMLAWSLLIAALVAWGCLLRSAAERLVMMAVCMLVLAGEPVLMGLLARTQPMGDAGWTMHVSPVQALWSMTVAAADFQMGPWQSIIVSVAAAAILAWGIVGVGSRMRAKR